MGRSGTILKGVTSGGLVLAIGVFAISNEIVKAKDLEDVSTVAAEDFGDRVWTVVAFGGEVEVTDTYTLVGTTLLGDEGATHVVYLVDRDGKTVSDAIPVSYDSETGSFTSTAGGDVFTVIQDEAGEELMLVFDVKSDKPYRGKVTDAMPGTVHISGTTTECSVKQGSTEAGDMIIIRVYTMYFPDGSAAQCYDRIILNAAICDQPWINPIGGCGEDGTVSEQDGCFHTRIEGCCSGDWIEKSCRKCDGALRP